MPTTQIFNQDVMTAMQGIPDGSVDLAVYDPPYKVISGGSNDKEGGEWSRPSGMLTKNDGKIFEHNKIEPEVYLPEVHRVLKEDAHMYMMINGLGLIEGDMLNRVRALGFKIHNLLVWRKNNATPNRWYMKDLEFTIFARKGKAFSINNKGSRSSDTAFDHPLDWDNVRPGQKAHPTEKPVDLMRTYIENSSQEGDLVIDPFMGAGSTGVACQITGRSFIGIELDPEYFLAAQERLGCPADEDLDFLG